MTSGKSMLALCFAAGCTVSPDAVGLAPVVTDSAGVEVVTYPAAVLSAPPVELEPLPLTDRAPGRSLGNLAGGLILPTGGIVLADGMARTVHEYSPAGEHIRSQGGEGQGPGEYEYIRGMGRCSATGFVVFNIDWTMNFHDSAGTWTNSRRPPASEGSPYHLACDESGNLATTQLGRSEMRPGNYVSMSVLRIVDSTGHELANLGQRVGSDRIGQQTQDMPHPIGRATRFGFQDHDLIVADGQFFGFERWGRDGTLKSIVRVDADPPDADSLMALYLEEALERAPNDDVRTRWRNEVRDLGLPEHVALLSDLFVSPNWIFVRETDVASGGRWFLFSGDGEPRGFVRMPPRSTFLDVLGDTVLLARRDTLDVPFAALYRVVLPDRRPG